MNKRLIGIATSARADFGLLTPLIDALLDDPDVHLAVYATGMHFSPRRGETINEVRAHGLGDRLVEIPCFAAADTPLAIGESMAAELDGFAKAFAHARPDILVVLGDRFDILPAVVGALNFNIAVAHIYGGEVTEGVIDDSIRHAITKMSHLHFAANEAYARRIIQLGEEPWRVMTTGGLGLDGIDEAQKPQQAQLFAELGLAENRPVTILTYHPETLDQGGSVNAITTILAAADQIDSQIVFTCPNADAGSSPIIDAIRAYCGGRMDCCFHASLGRKRYHALLNYADCMVGNSSSGIIEAASFRLPVVNIGDRQKGRIMAAHVIQAEMAAKAIAGAWQRALTKEFRQSLAGLINPYSSGPYGGGNAVKRILAVLKTTPLDRRLIVKRFHDLP